MPKKFDNEKRALEKKLVDMGELACEMLHSAVRALQERDAALIEKVHELEEKMDQHQVEIDEDVMRLLAVYGPVALDLRFVLMVARINTELERIGDQSVNMCEDVQLLLNEPELSKLVDLPRMADYASNMIRESLQSFAERKTSQAREVIKSDDMVDALNDKIFRDLLESMSGDASIIKRAVPLLFFARSLERIADHATNVAEEVIYMVKGEDVRHE